MNLVNCQISFCVSSSDSLKYHQLLFFLNVSMHLLLHYPHHLRVFQFIKTDKLHTDLLVVEEKEFLKLQFYLTVISFCLLDALSHIFAECSLIPLTTSDTFLLSSFSFNFRSPSILYSYIIHILKTFTHIQHKEFTGLLKWVNLTSTLCYWVEYNSFFFSFKSFLCCFLRYQYQDSWFNSTLLFSRYLIYDITSLSLKKSSDTFTGWLFFHLTVR
jgi:hypothetical protein